MNCQRYKLRFIHDREKKTWFYLYHRAVYGEIESFMKQQIRFQALMSMKEMYPKQAVYIYSQVGALCGHQVAAVYQVNQ